MASTAAATMVKAAVVAVLLMQCCDEILAARPLLHATAGADGGWQLGKGARTTMVMQVLDKGSGSPGGAGAGNCHWTKSGNAGCSP
jgi:DNA-binding IscR family transcriptional regulator